MGCSLILCRLGFAISVQPEFPVRFFKGEYYLQTSIMIYSQKFAITG